MLAAFFLNVELCTGDAWKPDAAAFLRPIEILKKELAVKTAAKADIAEESTRVLSEKVARVKEVRKSVSALSSSLSAAGSSSLFPDIHIEAHVVPEERQVVRVVVPISIADLVHRYTVLLDDVSASLPSCSNAGNQVEYTNSHSAYNAPNFTEVDNLVKDMQTCRKRRDTISTTALAVDPCESVQCSAVIEALAHVRAPALAALRQAPETNSLIATLYREVCDIAGLPWLAVLEREVMTTHCAPFLQPWVALQACSDDLTVFNFMKRIFGVGLQLFDNGGTSEAVLTFANIVRGVASMPQFASLPKLRGYSENVSLREEYSQFVMDLVWVVARNAPLLLLDDAVVVTILNAFDGHVVQSAFLGEQCDPTTAADDCGLQTSERVGSMAAMLWSLLQDLPHHHRSQQLLFLVFELIDDRGSPALLDFLDSELMCGVSFEGSSVFTDRVAQYVVSHPKGSDDAEVFPALAASLLCKANPLCSSTELRENNSCLRLSDTEVILRNEDSSISALRCEDLRAPMTSRHPVLSGMMWWHSYIMLLISDNGDNCVRLVLTERQGCYAVVMFLRALAVILLIHSMRLRSVILFLKCCVFVAIVGLVVSGVEERIVQIDLRTATSVALGVDHDPIVIATTVSRLANRIARGEIATVNEIPLPSWRTKALCSEKFQDTLSFAVLGAHFDDTATVRGLACTTTFLMEAVHLAVNSHDINIDDSDQNDMYVREALTLAEVILLDETPATEDAIVDLWRLNPLANAPLWALLNLLVSSFRFHRDDIARLQSILSRLVGTSALYNPLTTSDVDDVVNDMLIESATSIYFLSSNVASMGLEVQQEAATEIEAPKAESVLDRFNGWLREIWPDYDVDDLQLHTSVTDDKIVNVGTGSSSETCESRFAVSGAAQWATLQYSEHHPSCDFLLSGSDSEVMNCVEKVLTNVTRGNEDFALYFAAYRTATAASRNERVCEMVKERLKRNATGARLLHLINDTMLPQVESTCRRLSRESRWSDCELLLVAEVIQTPTRFVLFATTVIAYNVSGDEIFRSAVANQIVNGANFLEAAFLLGPSAGPRIGNVNSPADLETLFIDSEINQEQWELLVGASASEAARKHIRQRMSEASQIQALYRKLKVLYPDARAFHAGRDVIFARIQGAISEADAILNVVAVVALAAQYSLRRELRGVQFLALTELVSPRADVKHKVLQILTSEGKTLTVAVAAIAVHFLELHYYHDIDAALCVRVQTTTPQLVRDNLATVRALYELLNVSVSHNLEAHCPTAAVTYGTFESLGRDTLSSIAKNPLCRSHVPEKVTKFVDEDDLERYQSIANLRRLKISNPALQTGMWYLDSLFHIIFYRFEMFSRATLRVNDTCLLLNITMFSNEGADETVVSQKQRVIRFNSTQTAEQFFISETTKEVIEAVRDGTVLVPRFLHQLVELEARSWVESAVSSVNIIENRQYVIQSRNGQLRVEPVTRSTGAIHPNMRYEHGVHQFTELRNALPMRSLLPVSQYLTTYTLMNLGKRTRGVTGTVGSAEDRSTTRRVFGDDFRFWAIPSHFERRLVRFPDTALPSQALVLEQATVEALNFALLGRAVLIVIPDIDEALTANENFRAIHPYPDRVLLYTGRESDVIQTTDVLQPGTILVSTNIGGRGTDLQLADAVLDRGGLHVINTERMVNASAVQGELRGSRCATKGSTHTFFVQNAVQPVINASMFFRFRAVVPVLENASFVASEIAASIDRPAVRQDFEQQFAFYVARLWHRVHASGEPPVAQKLAAEINSFFQSPNSAFTTPNIFFQLKSEWNGVPLNFSDDSDDAMFLAPYYIQLLHQHGSQIDRVKDEANYATHRQTALDASLKCQHLLELSEDRLAAAAAIAESVHQTEASLRLKIRRAAEQYLRSYINQTTMTVTDCCEPRYRVTIWKTIDIAAIVSAACENALAGNASQEALSRVRDDVATQLTSEGYNGVPVFRLVYTPPPPPKKRGWWGTVLAGLTLVVQGVLGALSIAVGLVHIGAALLKNVAAGLIDIVVAIATGTPLDFVKWLGGQALKFAVSMLQVGVSFVSKCIVAGELPTLDLTAVASTTTAVATTTTDVVMGILREELTNQISSRVVSFATIAVVDKVMMPSLDEVAATAARNAVDNKWSVLHDAPVVVVCSSLTDQLSRGGNAVQQLLDAFEAGSARVVSRQQPSTVAAIFEDLGCSLAQQSVRDPVVSGAVNLAARTFRGVRNLARIDKLAKAAVDGGLAVWSRMHSMKSCNAAVEALFGASDGCHDSAKTCVTSPCFNAQQSTFVVLTNASCVESCQHEFHSCDASAMLAANDHVGRDASWVRASLIKSVTRQLSSLLHAQVVSPIASNLIQPVLTDAFFSISSAAANSILPSELEEEKYVDKVIEDHQAPGTAGNTKQSSSSRQRTPAVQKIRRDATKPAPTGTVASPKAVAAMDQLQTVTANSGQDSQASSLASRAASHFTRHRDEYLTVAEMIPFIGSAVTVFRMFTEPMTAAELAGNAISLVPGVNILKGAKLLKKPAMVALKGVSKTDAVKLTRQQRVAAKLADPAVSKVEKGDIINQIRRNKKNRNRDGVLDTKYLKNLKGEEMAHFPKFERAWLKRKGLSRDKSYAYTEGKPKKLHRLQHKFDNNGKKFHVRGRKPSPKYDRAKQERAKEIREYWEKAKNKYKLR